MTIRFRCPNCRKKYKVGDEYARSQVKCSQCGSDMQVPDPAVPAPPTQKKVRSEENDQPDKQARPAAAAAAVAAESQHASIDAAGRWKGDGDVADTEPDDPPVDPPITFNRQEEEGELDMTPMVDVTFLLLIFFMMTAAFSLQKSIEVPPPDAADAASQQQVMEDPEQDDDYIVVKVYADNTIWVEDSEAPSWHELLNKLSQQRRADREAGGQPRNRLLVLASGEARHEVVVRALDAASAIGMEGVRLARLEEEF